jgi:hypothetical protein
MRSNLQPFGIQGRLRLRRIGTTRQRAPRPFFPSLDLDSKNLRLFLGWRCPGMLT